MTDKIFILNFAPKSCPMCSAALATLDTSDFYAGASCTCKCGCHYAFAAGKFIHVAAVEAGSDLGRYVVAEELE